MNTDLEADLDLNAAPALTQADYDRAYKLDAGIKKLAAELDDLKARIKADAQTGTQVHGKVVVKVTERNDKDAEAMADNITIAEYPQYFKSVLDVAKVAKNEPDLVLYKPTIKVVSITFAD